MTQTQHPSPRRIRQFLTAASAVLLAASGTFLAVGPADAATIDPNAWYQLINRNSGKALDVTQASTADSANVVQYTANAAATSQQWQFASSGGGFYRLTARHSGKVLEVTANSTADGADVVQYTGNGGLNQQWSVTDVSGGSIKLLNRRSGKALDVSGNSTADNGDVVQWTDTGGANQQWQLVPLGGTPSDPPPSTPAPGPTPTKNISIPDNLGTHDPSRIINDNGSYYFYSTGRGIPGWYTTDGRTWRQTPAIFPNGIPASVRNAVPANDGYDVWAPDIIWNPNTRLFHLYYSVANWDITDRSAIGLVTSPTLNPNAANYRWTDRGVVIAKSPSYNIINAIDPAPFFDNSGNMWVAFGSGYGSARANALNVIALNKSTGLRSDSTLYTVQSCGCEAAYVQYHNGYYYLFWNTGGCCSGASSTYVIHVARSTSVIGPYIERSAKFFASTGNIHGPGHIGILSENGKDMYTYHYYPNSGGSVLGLGTITWGSDGWPNR